MSKPSVLDAAKAKRAEPKPEQETAKKFLCYMCSNPRDPVVDPKTGMSFMFAISGFTASSPKGTYATDIPEEQEALSRTRAELISIESYAQLVKKKALPNEVLYHFHQDRKSPQELSSHRDQDDALAAVAAELSPPPKPPAVDLTIGKVE